MYPLYEDILELAGDRQPLWWDSNGVPRFQPFHPSLVPCIYADEALLMIIECQACRRKFDVGLFWDLHDALVGVGPIDRKDLEAPINRSRLSSSIQAGEIPYYGDAPWHTINEYQCSGTTMTGKTLLIKEFWSHMSEGWVRKPEFEKRFL